MSTELKMMKPNESKILILDNNIKIIVLYAIGDGSCFYHSVCDCISKTYKNLIKKEDKVKYIIKFRRALSKWVTKTSNFNLKEHNYDVMFNKYVLNPNKIIYEQLNNINDIFNDLYNKDIPDFTELINNCSTENNTNLTEQLILESLNNSYITYNKNKISLKIENIKPLLNDSIPVKLVKQNLKYLFLDKHNFKYGKYNNPDIKLLKDAYYVKTNKKFTDEEIKYILNTDPRDDLDLDKDNILWKLPLNLNYFKLQNYKILEHVKYNITFERNSNTKLKIISLINELNSDNWATDIIISLIINILKINIFIINAYENNISKYNYYIDENNTKNIVIRQYNIIHFEPIGFINENEDIETIFNNDHKLILKLKNM